MHAASPDAAGAQLSTLMPESVSARVHTLIHLAVPCLPCDGVFAAWLKLRLAGIQAEHVHGRGMAQ